MDLVTLLTKLLTSLLGDPDHVWIMILTVVITVLLLFNNRNMRRALNTFADAANSKPDQVSQAVADKVTELQKPTLALWEQNVKLLTEDRERLKSELADLRSQFSQFQTKSKADQKELTDRIDTLLSTIDSQKEQLKQKDELIAERDKQLVEYQALKKQVDDLTAEVTRLKAQLQMQEKLQLERDQALSRAETAEATIRAKDAVITDLTEKLQKAEGELETLRGKFNTELALHTLHESPAVPADGTPAADAKAEAMV